MTPDEFRRHGAELIEFIARYYETLSAGGGERRVLSEAEPGDVFNAVPPEAPEVGEDFAHVISEIDRVVMPGITHWQSPGFFGYFPASATFPAILGELLSAGLGVQGMLWQTSPACTELETRMLDWMGRAIGLPEAFLSEGDGGGVIQGTASEAALVAMVAARQRALDDRGVEETDRAALNGRLVAYASEQAHSSIVKAAMVCGIGRSNVRLVGTDGNLAMDAERLRAQVEEDARAGLIPFFVCATLGTTSTGAIDPLAEIVRIVRPTPSGGGGWVHVDGAYAGAALVCPEHRGMIEGVELADSFNFNPHKWLLVNFDCSCLWVRDRAALVNALSITPEYLRNTQSDAKAVIDYRDWQVPLGRRFRAMKLWFVMRHYGLEGLRAHIREHVRLAELFESWVRADDRFEMVAPRSLSLVCFRLKAGDGATRSLLEKVNATGEVFVTHTVIPFAGGGGEPVYAIRFAVGAVTVTEADVARAWEIITAHAT
ncbi:ELI5 [Symbiodinium necroappetens]|uniref:ELI5 protein n=1 Tax=Symbiodinium necroappetens TaxID=1628268 RepID=A0A812K9W8_9DINO|nr:ELI5 [Symbiodinium necroappetens]